MNRLKTLAFALIISFAASAQVDTNSLHYYLFVYYVNSHDTAGARIALSTDGIYWEKINDEEPIFTPSISGEHLMRDPNMCFDKRTGVFHLVWTSGWNQKNIGYSMSKDLKNWSTQQCIPVGERIDHCSCCWAPEIAYDESKDSFMVYWSSDTGNGKLAFYSMTKNFKEFTAPVKLFDPGYTVIDETLFKASDGKYYLFFKDERTAAEAGKQTKNIHYVTGPTPQGPWDMTGPWDGVSKPLTNPGCGGPSIIQMGNEYRLYVDPYTNFAGTYRMVKTADLATTEVPWTQGAVLKTKEGDFLYSHGSISEIPRGKFMQLLYGIQDTTTYEPWITDSASVDPIGKTTHGCGAGVGLAFFPLLLLKAWANLFRKRKNRRR